MTNGTYPALYSSASAASKAAQAAFLRLTRAQFVLLALAATVGAWPRSAPDEQHIAAAVSLVLLLAVTGISVVMRVFRYDDRWFAARALAENVKSATWRYISLPAPSDDQERRRLDDELAAELRQIRTRFPERATKTAAYLKGGADVTPWMRKTLAMSLAEKRELFIAKRLDDQYNWYETKARENARLESRWLSGTIVLELVAVLAAALNTWLLLRFNPVPGLAALAAGMVGWARTKRFSDLANSYAVAAEDLRLLRTRADATVSEEEFADLVRDVETAISREHSMWVARRGV